MKCIKLAKTSGPTNLKDVTNFQSMHAQVAFEKFAKESERRLFGSEALAGDSLASLRNNVGDRVVTLGTEGMVHCHLDNGFFSTVLAAYNNHWKLRTAPDDWWYCVIKRVALAIDNNAGKKSVRQMFVDHEGKKSLVVDVSTPCIYDVDYDEFFQKISEQIVQNVKVPSYVDTVTADFTTTTPAMKIASQITVMSSLQVHYDSKEALLVYQYGI
jgi:hypothetical protein